MKIKRNTNYYTLACLATALTLSACGSGGGNGPSVMPPPVQQEQQPQQPPAQPEAEVPQVPAPQPPVDPQPEQPQQPKPEEMPQPPAQPEAEVPQAPAPQPPVAPKPEDVPQQPDTRVKADQEILEKLGIYSPHEGGALLDTPFKLMINDGSQKVELQVLAPHSPVGQSKLETLRDSDGRLIGYYGHARYSKQINQDFDEKDAEIRSYFLQNADDSMKQRPEGMGDITYQGKMIYRYDNNPNDADEAVVRATYHGRDKTLDMRITTKEQDIWTLHNDRSPRSITPASVGEDGSVSGYLAFTGNQDSRPIANGQFSGGLYGKNGSVLTGRASFENKENGWKGVVGATAAPASQQP
ncbi:hypothetical protein [Neisseria montereyensis]|uniref:hypothetical protein n=1 Tax=Neisseria montereyensis TaxID=2973938 RepID=UPI0025A49A75|nr:hypothetical protein [Neisseria montereyensis]